MRGLVLFAAGVVVGTFLMQPSAAQDNSNTGLRLNHVAIAVKDFQESLNFYTKVMGFRVAYSFPNPDGKSTTTFLQINRDTFLEVSPASANVPPGIRHIGIQSEDVNAAITRLRQNGATVEDSSFRPRTKSVLSSVTDPNGVRFELNEQRPDSSMRKAMESWK